MTDYHSNKICSKEVIIVYYTVEALTSKNRTKKHAFTKYDVNLIAATISSELEYWHISQQPHNPNIHKWYTIKTH